MNVFFDANILLDYLLRREPTFEASKQALRETIRLGHNAIISAASLNDIYYVLKKKLGNAEEAKRKLRELVLLFEIASVDGKAISTAFDLGGKDFEDDIVMATALGTGADCCDFYLRKG